MANIHGGLAGDAAALALLALFMVLALAEALWPARQGKPGSSGRIGANFALGAANLAIALLPVFSITAIAGFAADRQWGLFRLGGVEVPVLAEVALLLLAASLLGYGLHLAFHKVSWLWPLHAVHHHDEAVDLSTTLRQHPLAVIISTLVEGVLILALGPAIVSVLLARTLAFAAALFQHANIALPVRVSTGLERILVTPRLHLIHHASDRSLHDSNYGEILTVWDRLFGTFRNSPTDAFSIGKPVTSSAAQHAEA